MNARKQVRFDSLQHSGGLRNVELRSYISEMGWRRVRKPVLCLLLFLFVTRIESTPEEEAKTYYVVGITQNDRLKVRSAPSQTSRVVARLRNGDGGITITGKIVMNGTDDWIPIAGSGFEGWVRPKFLRPRADYAEQSQPAPTHKQLIGELLNDCQNQLIPVVKYLDNGRAMRALAELCPDSTPAQRASLRRALHLMTDDDFTDSVKAEGGIELLAPRIKAAAIRIDPSLVEKPCLLELVDETIKQLLTNPFGL